jgi:hypothetical protein
VLIVGAFSVASATSGSASSAAYRIGVALLVPLVLLILVSAGITLFNRPKFAVPPPGRDEPGALARWWRSRHASRAQRR